MNCCAEHTSTTETAKRSRTNITPIERTGRVVIGIFAAAFGVAGVTGTGSILAVVLFVLLIAASIDLVVTGATGHCPLYQKLDYLPRSLRSDQ
jgi:hypothetical protein